MGRKQTVIDEWGASPELEASAAFGEEVVQKPLVWEAEKTSTKEKVEGVTCVLIIISMLISVSLLLGILYAGVWAFNNLF